MHTPPADVSIGDDLTQEEIEDTFNTGFGYQISGINSRRDNNDNRYMLVFANEDGPYDDAVRVGRFEYIGEGLDGDQSEDSPGNSALIDAVSSDFPVYFFYAETDRPEWEYQGQVNVLRYQSKKRDGRKVLVFDMEHQEDEPDETDRDIDWLTAMRLELERYLQEHDQNTVTLHEIYDFSESRLAKQFPENDHVRAKIRQLLQRLRDRGEVRSLNDEGTYQIGEIQLENSIGLSLPVETGDTGSVNTPTHGLYLIPVNNDWRERFKNSVEEPHDLRQYENLPPQVEGIDRLRIWGTTETDGDKKQSAIDHMTPDDCLLFYYDGEFFAGGTVGRVFENPDVGKLLWNNPRSRHLFTVKNFTHSVPPIEEIWEMLGYEGRQVVQGFTRVADDRISNICEEHETLESLIHGTDDEEPPLEEIEEEKSELAQAVESEPELSKEDTEYVEIRRKARDSAFRELVREAYNNTCAVCGSQRESPDGTPEVEAAHIYPHSEGGSDDIRNGIALCKFHHWAFDSGWLSFTDNYEIMVAKATGKNGYHKLKEREGQSLWLPENEDTHPHPMFLREHRQLNGF